MRALIFTAALLTLLVPSVAQAKLPHMCSPLAQTARILATPNPNDIHPDWRGESTVGLAWSFEVKDSARSQTGTFYKGDLISPRGGTVNRNAFILASEWQCE
jgi:hypothetical protein